MFKPNCSHSNGNVARPAPSTLLRKNTVAVEKTYPDIRDVVTKLCGRFCGEYWRELDRNREYPSEFVSALTDAGYLSVLIPQEYGGCGFADVFI